MAHPNGIKLVKVHTVDGTHADVDIIAIHGLDTDSPGTWTWTPKGNGPATNWLSDPHMLPNSVGNANIWTCDWQSHLFLPPGQAPKSFEELARDLLSTLEDHIRQNTSATLTGAPCRPIVFIASCVGGLLLLKSIVLGINSTLLRSLSGVIFLATPFNSTSFERVGNWARPCLDAWAKLRGQKVTPLLDLVHTAAPEIDTLVRDFVSLWTGRLSEWQVFAFYELRNTNLLSKVRLDILTNAEPVVDRNSGTLQIVQHPLGLERPHVLMNKFPHLDDGCYKLVQNKIKEFLDRIRSPSSTLRRADEQIRKVYQDDKDRLSIERLSGDKLPMEQCYINLCIVEDVGDEIQDSRASNVILGKRHGIPPSQGSHVELKDLFNPREQKESNHPLQPRRIFIHGLPGVGKTTLCKKAMYDYLNCDAWRRLFDRILWIPLRNLTGREDRYNLQTLLDDEFFSQSNEKDAFTKAIIKECEKEEDSKTLFILDGLDEVWHGLPYGSVKRSCVLKLLNMPNVLVMTRPSVSIPTEAEPFDLRLETIGFNADQRSTYIRAVEPKHAPGIEAFLDSNKLIRDLCRIPIQLDALCYWISVEQPVNALRKVQTVTDLYTAIYESMERNDAKRRCGRSRSEQRTQQRTALELLEKTAFIALVDDQIIIIREDLRKAWDRLRPGDVDVPKVFEEIPMTSLVRASNISSNGHAKDSFHFLHLTYQEYFAARYVKRVLFDGKMDDKTGSPASVLKYKYAARFQMVWSFVSGLLSNEETKCFFERMNEEPLDLLGPAHHRLIMRCLSEVSCDDRHPETTALREKIEGQVTSWAVDGHQNLMRSPEFPIQSLIDISLRGHSATLVKWRKLGAIVMDLLVDGDWREIRHEAIAALKGRPDLPRTAFDGLIKCLSDRDWYVRREAIIALKGRPDLPQTFFDGLVKCLSDRDWSVRWAALDALKGRPDLPQTVLDGFVKCLSDRVVNVRSGAVDALKGRPDLPQATFDSIIKCLSDRDENVREGAVAALKGRQDLPQTAFDSIIKCLNDEDWDVRREAIDALNGWQDLPQTVLDGLIKCLNGEDGNGRWAAIGALKGRPDLPRTAFDGLIKCLSDRDRYIRQEAIYALKGRQDLPQTAFDSIIKCLNDEDGNGRWAAIEALKGRQDLPQTFFDGLVKCLSDENLSVKWAAIRALEGRQDLPQTVLDGLVKCLSDRGENVRREAIAALKGRPDLPQTVLDGLIKCLNDGDGNGRRGAVDALKGRPDLPQATFDSIIKCLSDRDENVRRGAVAALKGRQDLPQTAFDSIIKCLNDEDWDVRREAIAALKGRPDLPQTVLDGLIKCLNDEDGNGRWAALDALKGRQDLPQTFFDGLIKCLSDEDGIARWAALDALKGRQDLPQTVLDGLVKCLSDRDENVRERAVDIFIRNRGFNDHLSRSGNRSSIAAFRKALRERAYTSHISWHTNGETLTLETEQDVFI